jgi:hypothetical protein
VVRLAALCRRDHRRLQVPLPLWPRDQPSTPLRCNVPLSITPTFWTIILTASSNAASNQT